MGVEIDDSAQRVDSFPFRGPTAFMLGNEVRARTGERTGERAMGGCLHAEAAVVVRGSRQSGEGRRALTPPPAPRPRRGTG